MSRERAVRQENAEADVGRDDAIAGLLSRHIAGTASRPVPEIVVEKAKHHALDTFAAMVSGARLKAGRLAQAYVAAEGGPATASVAGWPTMTSPMLAALANGMAAHADETDDSHAAGRFHPGCGIFPAALAVAEARRSDGLSFLKAAILGYDLGVRFNLALGYPSPESGSHSSHCLGSAFGAGAAASALSGLDERQVRFALAYMIQQASGVRFWQRDKEHVEKAFDFGGMGARNGVAAASMVAAGFTGVEDPFTGPHNYFTAFAEEARPHLLSDGLDSRFEIMAAAIKKWTVGSPIQAALDSTVTLLSRHGFSAADVAEVVVRLPDDRAALVSDRNMPDICVQHMVAITLIDGTATFESSHDYDRMSSPDVLAMRARIILAPDAELTQARPERQAIVEVVLSDGRRFSERTVAVRGTPDNPMTLDEVEDKALELCAPILGAAQARELVEAVRTLETVPDMREIGRLIRTQA